MNIFGLHVTRRVLVLAIVAFLAVSLYRRSRSGRTFPNFTLRQRSEP